MPYHHLALVAAKLEKVHHDMSSPSKFVDKAMEIKGVIEAFRTVGRFDAFAIVHGDSDQDTLEAVKKVQGIPNVAYVEVFSAYPRTEPPRNWAAAGAALKVTAAKK